MWALTRHALMKFLVIVKLLTTGACPRAVRVCGGFVRSRRCARSRYVVWADENQVGEEIAGGKLLVKHVNVDLDHTIVADTVRTLAFPGTVATLVEVFVWPTRMW